MTSVFATLTQHDEESGRWWKTTAIENCGPGAPHRLAVVAAVIQEQFLNDYWNRRINRGSITFQHKQHRHQVVTVFIDKDNGLAKSYGLSVHKDPAVVAVELTTLPPYARGAIRKALSSRFKLYVEPQTRDDKIRFRPQRDHHFDVLFLRQGSCPYDPDPTLVSEIERAIGVDEKIL